MTARNDKPILSMSLAEQRAAFDELGAPLELAALKELCCTIATIDPRWSAEVESLLRPAYVDEDEAEDWALPQPLCVVEHEGRFRTLDRHEAKKLRRSTTGSSLVCLTCKGARCGLKGDAVT